MSNVGANETIIQKCIRERKKSDLISDKLSSKEYVEPLKGEAKVAKTFSLNLRYLGKI